MASDSIALRAPRAPSWRKALAPALAVSALAVGAVLLTAGRKAPSLLDLLLQWMPFFGQAFLLNILISVVAIGLGTVAGLLLAAAELSPAKLLNLPAKGFVGVFRNAPLLVLVFAASYALPFEIKVAGLYIAFPDWLKATLALTLPAAAHIAEIFRGALLSIPSAQWESASALAFGRGQTLRWIILPQCLKRCLPPWMNLYSTITMGTSLASLAGVDDLVHAANSASQTVHRTDFTIAVFPLVLIAFFLYCYPISRLTSRLERRFSVH